MEKLSSLDVARSSEHFLHRSKYSTRVLICGPGVTRAPFNTQHRSKDISFHRRLSEGRSNAKSSEIRNIILNDYYSLCMSFMKSLMNLSPLNFRNYPVLECFRFNVLGIWFSPLVLTARCLAAGQPNWNILWALYLLRNSKGMQRLYQAAAPIAVVIVVVVVCLP